MIQKIDAASDKEKIATYILSHLSDWFGLPESTQSYITESRDMPFWAAYQEEQPVGFIALKETSPATAEVFVMGVLPECHHSGLGRQLYQTFEQYAKEKGYSFVQVKTVQMGHYEAYDRTNRFYMAMGFQELECFPTLWDAWNPCQIYVKSIGC